MSSLDERIKDSSRIAQTALVKESVLFNEKHSVTTPVPLLNVALSGKVDGGLMPGFLQVTGPSKHFKSFFGLILMKSFLTQFPEGRVVFYDSEGGISESYMKSLGLDIDRIYHKPVTNIEQLKFDMMSLLEALNPDDKIMMFVDSFGNLASKKEVDDAIDQKSVADMSRAKALKSLGRTITPYLKLTKNVWLVGVNHVYDSIGFIPQQVVGGGQGLYLAADDIWIISRRQDKNTTGLKGYDFTINIEKSRTVKEKSKFPIRVGFKTGVSKYSGMLDLGLETGHIVKSGKKYALASGGEEYMETKIPKEFFKELLADDAFAEAVEHNFRLSTTGMMQAEEEDG